MKFKQGDKVYIKVGDAWPLGTVTDVMQRNRIVYVQLSGNGPEVSVFEEWVFHAFKPLRVGDYVTPGDPEPPAGSVIITVDGLDQHIPWVKDGDMWYPAKYYDVVPWKFFGEFDSVQLIWLPEQ